MYVEYTSYLLWYVSLSSLAQEILSTHNAHFNIYKSHPYIQCSLLFYSNMYLPSSFTGQLLQV